MVWMGRVPRYPENSLYRLKSAKLAPYTNHSAPTCELKHTVHIVTPALFCLTLNYNVGVEVVIITEPFE